MISKQYFSNFDTYETPPGFYSIKVKSEADYTMSDQEAALDIEYDDKSVKTKPILTQFGGFFGELRLDEKSFFSTSLGFTQFWVYRPTSAIHADSPGVYAFDKSLDLSTKT